MTFLYLFVIPRCIWLSAANVLSLSRAHTYVIFPFFFYSFSISLFRLFYLVSTAAAAAARDNNPFAFIVVFFFFLLHSCTQLNHTGSAHQGQRERERESVREGHTCAPVYTNTEKCLALLRLLLLLLLLIRLRERRGEEIVVAVI